MNGSRPPVGWVRRSEGHVIGSKLVLTIWMVFLLLGGRSMKFIMKEGSKDSEEYERVSSTEKLPTGGVILVAGYASARIKCGKLQAPIINVAHRAFAHGLESTGDVLLERTLGMKTFKN